MIVIIMFREQNCKQTTELVFDVSSIGILMTTKDRKMALSRGSKFDMYSFNCIQGHASAPDTRVT